MSGAPAISVFVACAVAYGVLGLMLRPSMKGERSRHGRLHLAALVTVIWAAVSGWLLVTDLIGTELTKLSSIALLSVWLWHLEPKLRAAGQPGWFVRLIGVVAPAMAATLLVVALLPLPEAVRDQLPRMVGVSGVLLATLGLISLEQFYRNATAQTLPAARWLCLGIGAIFVVELLSFVDVFMRGSIGLDVWISSAALIALSAVPIGLGARRMPDWKVGFFVSRQVVFYTTAFFLVGAFLVLASLGALLLPQMGGSSGRFVQASILLGAALVLAISLFSGALRRRLWVFISTHFYRNRYDYRIEWQRFSGTLSDPDPSTTVQQKAIRAVTQIVDSPRGLLWARDETGLSFSCVACWPGVPKPADSNFAIAASSPLPAFLIRTAWLIDLRELQDKPELYDGLRRDDIQSALPEGALIVPLLHVKQLYGWLVLERPKDLGDLTFEDRDLLKIAGRQAAAHLAQFDADGRLAEARQFEAYSRMTAFVMHDLKNLAAQLGLVVQNAERHKRNPAFVDDAMQTLALSTARMGRLIAQLTSGETREGLQVVDLAAVAERVALRCGTRAPVPKLEISARPLIHADPERLANILEHAVRNAQDASEQNGTILIALDETPGSARLRVQDTGVGMDAEFIRDRLFRPFDTTKGSRGMGIGAFQIREYMRSLGGSVEVVSEPGRGTTLTLLFSDQIPDAQMRRTG